MTNIHLHSEDKTLATVLARIRGEPVKQRKDLEPMYQEPVPEPNRSLLLGFHRSLVTEELCLGRIGVLMGNMYRISIWLKHKPFEEVTKDDLIDLVEKIRRMKVKRNAKAIVREGYAEQTIESYKITLKKFWKWLRPQENPDQVPSEVSWIRRRRSKNGLLPKDVWTPEEVNRVAGLASNMRDRAFVLGLFGSGCRIGGGSFGSGTKPGASIREGGIAGAAAFSLSEKPLSIASRSTGRWMENSRTLPKAWTSFCATMPYTSRSAYLV